MIDRTLTFFSSKVLKKIEKMEKAVETLRPERIDFRVVRALLQILLRSLVKQSRSLFSSYWKNVDDT